MKDNKYKEENDLIVNIVLAGPRGRMGTEAIKMILNEDTFHLVGCIDSKNNGTTLKEIHDLFEDSIPIYDKAETCFNELKPDIFVDLTVPQAGFEHTKVALSNHIRSV